MKRILTTRWGRLERWEQVVLLILVVVLLNTVGTVTGFYLYGQSRESARRDVCHAIIDDRLTFRDALEIFAPPSLREQLPQERRASVEAQLDQIEKRLNQDVEVCRSVGIDIKIDLALAPDGTILATTYYNESAMHYELEKTGP